MTAYRTLLDIKQSGLITLYLQSLSTRLLHLGGDGPSVRLHLFERKDDQQVRRGIVYVPANVEFGLPAKRLDIYLPRQSSHDDDDNDLDDKENRPPVPVVILLGFASYRLAADTQSFPIPNLAHQIQSSLGVGVVVPSLTAFTSSGVNETTTTTTIECMVGETRECIKWVGENIARYGGDAGKVWLMGYGAGAHIASVRRAVFLMSMSDLCACTHALAHDGTDFVVESMTTYSSRWSSLPSSPPERRTSLNKQRSARASRNKKGSSRSTPRASSPLGLGSLLRLTRTLRAEHHRPRSGANANGARPTRRATRRQRQRQLKKMKTKKMRSNACCDGAGRRDDSGRRQYCSANSNSSSSSNTIIVIKSHGRTFPFPRMSTSHLHRSLSATSPYTAAAQSSRRTT